MLSEYGDNNIKHRCLFLKLAARMGAYFHGDLMNACNFLVACSRVGMEYILGLKFFFC